MKISIIGTGYVGLVTGACFSDVGNQVMCIDNDAAKIEKLSNGYIPIYEPGLDALVESGLAQGRLQFRTDVEVAVAHAEVIFIAVGTPPGEDGAADLSYVLQVASSIGQYITEPIVIVTKSTVPVGTAAKVRNVIQDEITKRGLAIEFSVASNPEFLKEGAAIDDFMKPDRVVLGADDERTVDLMRALYAPFNRNRDRLIVMDIPSAELTKYAANALLATKISFMNELSNIAESLGADIEAVRQGIGSDPRIGYHFIYPGCGYGGSCFPKDVQALQRTASEYGYNARILQAVEDVNHDQKKVLLNKVIAHFGEDLSDKKVAIWGLAFKPNTDDMREAPSVVVINGLLEHGAKVSAYDPVAVEEAQSFFSNDADITFHEHLYSATEDVDALIIVTEWKAFRSPDFTRLKQQMRTPIIFDGRNIYEPSQMNELGFRYFGIGRSH